MPGRAGDDAHFRSTNLHIDCRRRVSCAARATVQFQVEGRTGSLCQGLLLLPRSADRARHSRPFASSRIYQRRGAKRKPGNACFSRVGDKWRESLKKVAEYISTN